MVPSITWGMTIESVGLFAVREFISVSEVSIGLRGGKGVPAKEPGSRSVRVYGFISIFLQLLEV